MPRILVPLAEGCEEIEAVTVIDLLRRARFEVVAAGLAEGSVRASRGVVLVPDTTLDAALESGADAFDMVVLPGGGPGSERLAEDPRILELLRAAVRGGRHVAAICAAPQVLAKAGLLEGRNATSFPGVLDASALPGVTLRTDPVVVDGTIVTSRGPGTAMDFALTLIEILAGRERRLEVERPLQRPAR